MKFKITKLTEFYLFMMFLNTKKQAGYASVSLVSTDHHWIKLQKPI